MTRTCKIQNLKASIEAMRAKKKRLDYQIQEFEVKLAILEAEQSASAATSSELCKKAGRPEPTTLRGQADLEPLNCADDEASIRDRTLIDMLADNVGNSEIVGSTMRILQTRTQLLSVSEHGRQFLDEYGERLALKAHEKGVSCVWLDAFLTHKERAIAEKAPPFRDESRPTDYRLEEHLISTHQPLRVASTKEVQHE